MIKTDDLYEAAWYLTQGGVLTDIIFGKVQPNKINKKGFTKKVTVTISELRDGAVRAWREHTAVVNVRDYANHRLRLKEKINKRILKINHES